MRAAVIHRAGATPELVERDEPSTTADEQVILRVEAAALNAIDLHIASGTHRAGPPAVPYIPALESVGVVQSGPDAGSRVRAFVPAGLAPGVDGGLAELQLVDRASCVPVPDELDSVTAAAIGVVGTAAELALAAARLTPDESVLVLGATGPFGSAFVQLARRAGAARVIAAARHPERLADHLGVDGLLTLGDEPLHEQLAACGGAVDLVVDPVWGEWAEPALRCLRRHGRCLNVGAAAGDGLPFHSELLRGGRLALIGFSGASADPADLLASYGRVAGLAAAEEFALPTQTFALDDAGAAWSEQAHSPGRKLVIVP